MKDQRSSLCAILFNLSFLTCHLIVSPRIFQGNSGWGPRVCIESRKTATRRCTRFGRERFGGRRVTSERQNRFIERVFGLIAWTQSYVTHFGSLFGLS